MALVEAAVHVAAVAVVVHVAAVVVVVHVAAVAAAAVVAVVATVVAGKYGMAKGTAPIFTGPFLCAGDMRGES